MVVGRYPIAKEYQSSHPRLASVYRAMPNELWDKIFGRAALSNNITMMQARERYFDLEDAIQRSRDPTVGTDTPEEFAPWLDIIGLPPGGSRTTAYNYYMHFYFPFMEQLSQELEVMRGYLAQLLGYIF